MNPNLLDYEEQEQPNKNIFSKIALGFGIAAVLGLAYVLFAPIMIKASESLRPNRWLLFLLSFLS